MPSAATTFTNNNNNSKEKRASVSSIGASSIVGGGVGGGGSGGCNNSNGPHSSNTNLADCGKSAGPAGAAAVSGGSQNDLSNNNVNAKALKLAAAEPYNPMKQILVTIEHKIRNLEKRKTKLESYRAIQSSGKDLSADQAAAVAKYDSVLATLDFARDFAKQSQMMFKDAEKEQKKQARKDNVAKAVAETAKIRELLVMQNVLTCFNDEQIRNDFLCGENGACKLEPNELDALEKFCMEVQTRRPETLDDISFLTTAQKAADIFAMTINARAKPYGELTFEKMRALFQQIQDSGYLDKYYMIPPDQNAQGNSIDSGAISGEGDALLNDVGTGMADHDGLISEPSAHNSLEEGLDKLSIADAGNALSEMQHPDRAHMLLEPQHQRAPVDQQLVVQQQAGVYNATGAPATAGNTTPVHVLYAAPQQPQAGHVSQQGQHPHKLLNSPVNLQALHGVPPSQPPQAGVATAPVVAPQQQQHFGPTTVRAVEHNYFKQPPQQPSQPAAGLQAPTPQQQQQFMQQLRPLADVLGNGNFHFLQDSELDGPEVMPPQQKQQQPQAPPPQQLPVQGLVFEHSQQQQQNHVNEPQTITTLTFTNQSFPSLQQQQPQQQPQQPLQQQQQQQLFSPVLIPERQQPQMLIMAHLQPQQQQQAAQGPQVFIGMQPGDVTAVFPCENPIVRYEQELRQRRLKPQQPQQEEQQQQAHQQQQTPITEVEGNEWHGRGPVNDTNAAATAALSNVLKTQSSALGEQATPTSNSNKWSSEMNAMSSAASNGSNSSNSNKQEWNTPRDTSSGRGGYANDNDSTNNHWNSNSSQQQQQDNGSQVRRNSGNYQQRRNGGGGGGDERGRNGGGNYRSRQYGNSSSTQQNGRNSGVYFRNNESSGGGNNYYQNGNGGGVYNKDSRYDSSGGGSYRGQRGGNQRNGNGPFGRTMGDRGRNTGGGGPGNGGGSGGGGSGYINQRQSQQQQQRMPLGLENKN